MSIAKFIFNRERGFVNKIPLQKHVEVLIGASKVICEENVDKDDLNKKTVFALNIIIPSLSSNYNKIWIKIDSIEIMKTKFKFIMWASHLIRFCGARLIENDLHTDRLYEEQFQSLIENCKKEDYITCFIEEENQFSDMIKHLFKKIRSYRITLPSGDPGMLPMQNLIRDFSFFLYEKMHLNKPITITAKEGMISWIECTNIERFELDCKVLYNAAEKLRVSEFAASYKEIDLLR